MRRLNIELADIAERGNLVLATAKAAKGKRQRADVRNFTADLDTNLNKLSVDITQANLPYNRFTEFKINDPKPRLIHVTCFQDRVFHHALMNLAGEKLNSAMSHNSYACRPNKGVHRAAQQVQSNLRRFRYYCKIDISSYFATINHVLLFSVLKQRFKGADLMEQVQRIIDGYHVSPSYGLPIGSLTSQYFANVYLDGFDRYLEQNNAVRASVRYMDDVIWWCDSQAETKVSLKHARAWLLDHRDLRIKQTVEISSSATGVLYCGYRINREAITPSRRRKKRFIKGLRDWQQRYRIGEINSLELQAAYSSLASILAHTSCHQWRRKIIEHLTGLDV